MALWKWRWTEWFNIRPPTWVFSGDSDFFWQSKDTQVWLTGDFKWPVGVNVAMLFYLYMASLCVFLRKTHRITFWVWVVGGTSGLFNCTSLGCKLTFGAAWCGSGWWQGLVHLWVWGVSGKMASCHLLQKPVSLVLVLLLLVGTPGSNDALIALRPTQGLSFPHPSPLASAWVPFDLYLHPVHPKFPSSPKKPL